MKLDKLYQSGKVQDYVLDFQGLAWKTGYSDGELEHRFIVGLKEDVWEKCLLAYPEPKGLSEWIARAYAYQHQIELLNSIKQGRSTTRTFPTQNLYASPPRPNNPNDPYGRREAVINRQQRPAGDTGGGRIYPEQGEQI